MIPYLSIWLFTLSQDGSIPASITSPLTEILQCDEVFADIQWHCVAESIEMTQIITEEAGTEQFHRTIKITNLKFINCKLVTIKLYPSEFRGHLKYPLKTLDAILKLFAAIHYIWYSN